MVIEPDGGLRNEEVAETNGWPVGRKPWDGSRAPQGTYFRRSSKVAVETAKPPSTLNLFAVQPIH